MSESVPGSISRAGDSAPDVEYRLSRRYRRPMLARFAVAAVLTVICVVSRNAALEAAAYATGALAVIFGILYLWQGRFATRVTGCGIEVHGYFSHFVPWEAVRDIEVTSFGSDLAVGQDYGSQMYASGTIRGQGVRMVRTSPNRMAVLAAIKLVRADGRKLRLRAPLVSGWASDPDFADKAKQLEQLCVKYGRGALG
jgi:hypothetical protein